MDQRIDHRLTVYVCIPSPTSDLDTAVIRTFPRDTDFVVGSMEVNLIPKGTVLYPVGVTAGIPKRV